MTVQDTARESLTDENIMKNIIMNKDQHKSINSVLLLHHQTVCLNMFSVKAGTTSQTHLTYIHIQARCNAKVMVQSTPLYTCEFYTGSHESLELSSSFSGFPPCC